MKSITTLFSKLWRFRALLWRSILHEVRVQYAGTLLGIAWVMLGPALLLMLYTVVYLFIYRIQLPQLTIAEYILNVFSGLVPFLAFSQALTATSTCLKANKKLLFNTLFPTEFILIKTVLTAYITLGVGMIMILCGDAIFAHLGATFLLVPIVMGLQLLFSIGVGMFIALISLIFKDIQFLIQYIIIALLIVTPISYTPDMIPQRLTLLLYLNPLSYFVFAYQHLIILDRLPSLGIALIGTGLSLACFWAGIWFFDRVQSVIKDLV